MSAFNPNSHKLTAAEWQEIAKDRNEETGAQFTIVGGVVLGLFAAAAASPITGLLVAGYFGYKAWQDTQAANRNEEAIESYGCVAHLLKASDLKDYARQVGADTAIAEITFALENGYRATTAAIEFLEARGVDVDALMSPALPAAKEREAETPPIEPESNAPALSNAPMVDGIEKKAELTLPQIEELPQSQPAADYSDSRNSISIATPATPQPACPIRYLIGARLRTSLIVSVSGGGKDILLSNALREFQKVYPAFRVVIADCKDDPKEYGYYDGLPNVSIHRLNVAIASDGEVVQWVDDWVSEFVHLPENALLICNEGTLIRAKCKRYVDAVDGLVSSGDSRQKYCWEAGQSAHTKALKIDGDGRSRFRLLLIGLKGEEMQVEAILQAQCVADSARNMSDIKTQMMRSSVSRAWCDGQAWYAMPKLENYSGYDRDSRSHLAGYATPHQQQLRDRLEGIYQETNSGTMGTNFVPDDETVSTAGDDGDEPETNFGTNGTMQPQGFEPSDVEAVTNFVSSLGTKETTLFEAVLQGFRDGLSPSDIVKESLKLKKQYQEGRSLCVYLVRKYGQFDLLMHFKKWLEE